MPSWLGQVVATGGIGDSVDVVVPSGGTPGSDWLLVFVLIARTDAITGPHPSFSESGWDIGWSQPGVNVINDFGVTGNALPAPGTTLHLTYPAGNGHHTLVAAVVLPGPWNDGDVISDIERGPFFSSPTTLAATSGLSESEAVVRAVWAQGTAFDGPPVFVFAGDPPGSTLSGVTATIDRVELIEDAATYAFGAPSRSVSWSPEGGTGGYIEVGFAAAAAIGSGWFSHLTWRDGAGYERVTTFRTRAGGESVAAAMEAYSNADWRQLINVPVVMGNDTPGSGDYASVYDALVLPLKGFVSGEWQHALLPAPLKGMFLADGVTLDEMDGDALFLIGAFIAKGRMPDDTPITDGQAGRLLAKSTGVR